MFPIGDIERVPERRSIVNWILIGINVLVFLLLEVPLMGDPQALQQFVTEYGVVPREIMQGQDLFTLLTSMFLHGGWMHLIGNMLFLWVFGDNIETILGSIPYLLFYLVGGLIASFAHILFNTESLIPSVGASGAISAVMGAYIVMFPENQIRMLFLFFGIRIGYISALMFLGFWGLTQFINSAGSVVTTTETGGGGVAYLAHAGGFLVGLVVGALYRGRARQMAEGRSMPQVGGRT